MSRSSRHPLQFVLTGGVLRLVLAVIATRVLRGLLYEIDTLDLLTFVGVRLVLNGAGSATRVEPARVWVTPTSRRPPGRFRPCLRRLM